MLQRSRRTKHPHHPCSECEFCHSLRYDMKFQKILTFRYPVLPMTNSIAPYSSNPTSLFVSVRSSPILPPESYRVCLNALSLGFVRASTIFWTSSSVIMFSNLIFLLGWLFVLINDMHSGFPSFMGREESLQGGRSS